MWVNENAFSSILVSYLVVNCFLFRLFVKYCFIFSGLEKI